MPFAANTVGGWEVVFAKYSENVGALASFIPSKEVLGNYYYNWWDYALLLVFGGIAWQAYQNWSATGTLESNNKPLEVLPVNQLDETAANDRSLRLWQRIRK